MNTQLHGTLVSGVHLSLTESSDLDEPVVHQATTAADGSATFPCVSVPAQLELDYEAVSSFDYALPDDMPFEVSPSDRRLTIDLFRSRSWVLRTRSRPCDPLHGLPGIAPNDLFAASPEEERDGFVKEPDLEEACRTVAIAAAQSRSQVPWLIFAYSLYTRPCGDERIRGYSESSLILHDALAAAAGQDFGRCPNYWRAWWNQSFPTECLPHVEDAWIFPN